MMKVDMWYGNKPEECDGLDFTFYDLDCEYRGNLYIGNKIVGDYACNDSVQLEKWWANTHNGAKIEWK